MSTRFGSLARAALAPVGLAFARSLAFALGLGFGVPLALAGPTTLQAQETLSDLRSAVEARAAEHRGVVGVAAIDPVRGETLAIRGDERFPTASVIKVPILVEMFHQVATGPLSLDDPVVALEADLKPGSGILQYLSTPHQMTLRDAALLMIAHSDNTASNLVIDRVGIGAVNARMDSLGMPRTRLYRELFGQNSHSLLHRGDAGSTPSLPSQSGAG
ncbi:MAG TPA: serine hydrolase, partial [Longimicrobiales bacterium]|nr:serine hydrolase [Longimicrobiales bacterium]